MTYKHTTIRHVQPVRGIAFVLGALVLVLLAAQTADAHAISYRIHPDILTELQDRYPEHATEYWNDIQSAIRDGLNHWSELNAGLIFTPSHDNRADITIAWTDSSRVWDAAYHDPSGGNYIGIDFDTPEPDVYDASLVNPDIVRYVMAHNLGHALGIGHNSEEGHLMHGLGNPRPDNHFNDRGYVIPHVPIGDSTNVGGDKLDIAFHIKGNPVYDIETMNGNGTQYMVVAAGDNEIYVVNMSDPYSPSLAGSYDIDTRDTESLDGWPYLVVLHDEGISVLNMTDPSDIVVVGFIDGVTEDDDQARLVRVDDTIALVTTMGSGMARQYDVTDPSNIMFVGGYHDNFTLPAQGIQVSVLDGITYAILDVGYDGDVVLRVSAQNSLAKMKTGPTYDGTIRTAVSVDDTDYYIAYWRNQILVHESTSDYSSDPVGRLLGYNVLEIDHMKVAGAVYAVVAAGTDGVFGIHIGDVGTGEWTFN